jgi:hypothetical protein
MSNPFATAVGASGVELKGPALLPNCAKCGAGWREIGVGHFEHMCRDRRRCDTGVPTDVYPETTKEHDIICPWNGEEMPPPRATVPGPHFRIKGGVLQQLHSHPGGGRVRWWIDVPTVEEFEPDVVPG